MPQHADPYLPLFQSTLPISRTIETKQCGLTPTPLPNCRRDLTAWSFSLSASERNSRKSKMMYGSTTSLSICQSLALSANAVSLLYASLPATTGHYFQRRLTTERGCAEHDELRAPSNPDGTGEWKANAQDRNGAKEGEKIGLEDIDRSGRRQGSKRGRKRVNNNEMIDVRDGVDTRDENQERKARFGNCNHTDSIRRYRSSGSTRNAENKGKRKLSILRLRVREQKVSFAGELRGKIDGGDIITSILRLRKDGRGYCY